MDVYKQKIHTWAAYQKEMQKTYIAESTKFYEKTAKMEEDRKDRPRSMAPLQSSRWFWLARSSTTVRTRAQHQQRPCEMGRANQCSDAECT